jgi:hypothetical protein
VARDLPVKVERRRAIAGALYLNRFFRTFGAKIKLFAGHPKAALAPSAGSFRAHAI